MIDLVVWKVPWYSDSEKYHGIQTALFEESPRKKNIVALGAWNMIISPFIEPIELIEVEMISDIFQEWEPLEE